MKKFCINQFVALFVLIFFIQEASTCTIFSIYPKKQHWIGRTFDWSYGHGHLFTNKRNVTKTGLRLLTTDVSATWTSRYGSVTFNQFGREFPTGGMNEAGLMVDALELKSSIFPIPDLTPSFNELQFMQYLLDNYATVESIKKDLPKIRLAPVGSKLHYFTCDINKCMTIEFINGHAITRMKDELEISGLANNTYDEHVEYARNFITFGGTKPVVMDSKKSLDRFVRANYKAKFINQSENPVQTVFSILNDVGTKNNRWQIIYNQTERTIHFRTTAQLELQRKIDLKKFDFNCQKAVQYFDLDNSYEGPINNHFSTYDPVINYALIKKSVEMQGLPAALADRLAIYPSETTCE